MKREWIENRTGSQTPIRKVSFFFHWGLASTFVLDYLVDWTVGKCFPFSLRSSHVPVLTASLRPAFRRKESEKTRKINPNSLEKNHFSWGWLSLPFEVEPTTKNIVVYRVCSTKARRRCTTHLKSPYIETYPYVYYPYCKEERRW